MAKARLAERILYDGSRWIAGILMIAILVMVVLQMLSRIVGVVIPGVDEFASYFVSASLFFGLAPTLRAHGHIRLQTLLSRLPAKLAVAADFVATCVGLLIAVILAYALIDFTWDSVVFKEVASTLLPTPLWIPRALMAIGAVLFAVAMAHRLFELGLELRDTVTINPYAGKPASEGAE